jgi:hypothetical protein
VSISEKLTSPEFSPPRPWAITVLGEAHLAGVLTAAAMGYHCTFLWLDSLLYPLSNLGFLFRCDACLFLSICFELNA